MKNFLINMKTYFNGIMILYLGKLGLKLRGKNMSDALRKEYVDGIYELADILIKDINFTDLALELYILGLAFQCNTTEKIVRVGIGEMIKDNIKREAEQNI